MQNNRMFVYLSLFLVAVCAAPERTFEAYSNSLSQSGLRHVAFSGNGMTLAYTSSTYLRRFGRSGEDWIQESGLHGPKGDISLSYEGNVHHASIDVGATSWVDNDVDNIARGVSPVGGWDAVPNYPNMGRGASISWDGMIMISASDTLTAGTGAVHSYDRASGAKDVLEIPHSISALSASSDGRTIVIGLSQSNGGVGGFSIVELSADFTSLSTDGVVYTGTGNVGNSRQGESVAISPNGQVIAVGAPYDSTVFDVQGTVTELGAVWMFSYDAAHSAWAQMTDKLRPRDFVEGSAPVRMGQTVSLDTRGECLLTTSFTDNDIGAAWVFARNGHDVFAWSQQDGKYAGTVNDAVLAGNGYEMAISHASGVRVYKETMYFRIKMKMWGCAEAALDSSSAYNAPLITAFANALSIDVSAVTNLQYKPMTGHSASDVVVIATIKAYSHDHTTWNPVDNLYRQVLSSLYTGAFKSTVEVGGAVNHIGDVSVRLLFAPGF